MPTESAGWTVRTRERLPVATSSRSTSAGTVFRSQTKRLDESAPQPEIASLRGREAIARVSVPSVREISIGSVPSAAFPGRVYATQLAFGEISVWYANGDAPAPLIFLTFPDARSSA